MDIYQFSFFAVLWVIFIFIYCKICFKILKFLKYILRSIKLDYLDFNSLELKPPKNNKKEI